MRKSISEWFMGILVVVIFVLALLNLIFVFKNKTSNTELLHHIDSIESKVNEVTTIRDSLIQVVDTDKVKIIRVQNEYHKEIERINALPMDSAYLFWSEYIERFRLENDSDTIKNK